VVSAAGAFDSNASRPDEAAAGILGWHFARGDRRLPFGDRRLIARGATHEAYCTSILRLGGLDGCERITDALDYARGTTLSRIELSGRLARFGDRVYATRRRYIEVMDATNLLRSFARSCALTVSKLWNQQRAVVDYLSSGDDALRELVWALAGASMRSPDRAAAWAAQAAAWAALDMGAATAWMRPTRTDRTAIAARAAVHAAVRAAAAASGAIGSAEDVRSDLDRGFERMALEAMNLQ